MQNILSDITWPHLLLIPEYQPSNEHKSCEFFYELTCQHQPNEWHMRYVNIEYLISDPDPAMEMWILWSLS